MPTEMNEEFLQQYGNRIRKLGYLLDTSEASVEVRELILQTFQEALDELERTNRMVRRQLLLSTITWLLLVVVLVWQMVRAGE